MPSAGRDLTYALMAAASEHNIEPGATGVLENRCVLPCEGAFLNGLPTGSFPAASLKAWQTTRSVGMGTNPVLSYTS